MPIKSFQIGVSQWLVDCLGVDCAMDTQERNHRFLEEALELVQSKGCTASEAHQLVDYVFNRPVGEPVQEVGGVMVTLAALCTAAGIDLSTAADDELRRIWTKVPDIRAKHAAKPKHSPLPANPATVAYPAVMNDKMKFVLGLPNFRCGPEAQRLRLAGADIPHKAEAEQAAVIHWLLPFAIEGGEDWLARAMASLTEPEVPRG